MTLHRTLRIAVAVLATALVAAAAGQRLVPVADGFVQPLGVVAAFDGSGRLFVVEQRGTVVAVAPDGRTSRWLDLQARTRAQGERGLLGLAFHPDFARNGRVFVHYTDRNGGTVLSELRAVDPAGGPVDPRTEEVLFTLPQPYGNHNGGQVAFGPDGMLYLALGDGGSGGDPLNAGQDLSTPLGSLLRFDVDAAPGRATVPTDNPFVGTVGARAEIWAYGLRNPWRFAFDTRTGDLWIADVGQNAVEEVNLLRAGTGAGANLGWRVMEGDRCFDPPRGCDPAGLVLPVATYTHDSGWGRSITGGVVPYGPAAPSLAGRYLFGDFVSGRLFVLGAPAAGVAVGSTIAAAPLLDTGFSVAAFGLDEALDAYVADYGRGVLYRIED